MKTFNVSYENLATHFDHDRALTQAKKALWSELFIRYFNLSHGSFVLDIGCGTGRFTELMQDQFHCKMIGIDPSCSMLDKAKIKTGGEICFVLGMGENLPFPPNTFDLCFASQVIQHFHNKHQAIEEAYRVLRNNGIIGIRTSSHSQLKTILDYRFFPSGIQIECERLPDISDIRKMLLDVGFKRIKEHPVTQPLFESPENYLEKLRNRYASFLSIIPEDEYQKGINYAAEYLHEHLSHDDKYAEITLLIGIK